MAITLVRIQSDLIIGGNRRASLWNVTGDSFYPSGGYAVTGANFGLRSIEGIDQWGTNTTGSTCVYNTLTGKLQFYTNGSEASGNIATVINKILVISTDD